MKYLLFFFPLFFLLSCENEQNFLTRNMNSSPTLHQASYHCTGKSCLPFVKITGDNHYVTVSWNHDSFSNDHTFKLIVEGDGQYVSSYVNRSEWVESNGYWSFHFPNLTEKEYKIRYKITCIAGNSNCTVCDKSGSYLWRSDGTGGNMGDYEECYREYYPYQIKVENQDVILTRSTFSEAPGVKYMDVNKAILYKTSGTTEEKIKEAGIEQIGYDQFRISGLAMDFHKTYKVVLINTMCQSSEYLHYLYFTYYYDGLIRVSQYNPSLVDFHTQIY